MAARVESAQNILRTVFGFESFRPGQEDIIKAVLKGRDVLAVLPTGGGKSLCYQVPALVFPACTLVVSPLIALMTDQVNQMREKGVQAFALNASMSRAEFDAIVLQAQRGTIKLLYIAPERLESTQFRKVLATIPISLVAVDEAHCISEWGHDFRPSYRSIPAIFDIKQRIPIIALTATATPDVRADIVQNLRLHQHIEFVRGFDRPNLTFRVEQTPHKIEFISRVSKQDPTSTTIVYAGSRRRVETITEELRKRKLNVSGYHAGRSALERSLIQDRFLQGDVSILVATNAFGMGVDKSNIRQVIHADLPLTLEAYYQEAGRAGRDGLPSVCTLLYQSEDKHLAEFFIESTFPEEAMVNVVVKYLYQRSSAPKGTIPSNPILADEASISVDLHKPLGKVRGVIALLERSGILLRTTPQGLSKMRLRSTMQRLHDFVDNSPPERRPALEVVERLLGSAASNADIDFSLYHFLRKTGISSAEFSNAIQALHVARILRYTTPDTTGGFLLTTPFPEKGSDLIDMPDVHKRREHAERKLDIMIRYAETPTCKRNFILTYFNDNEVSGDCGHCSSCLKSSVRENASISDIDIQRSLIRAVSELGGRFGRNVVVDVITGTISTKTVAYKLDRASTWGSCSASSRAAVMRVLDQCITQGLIVRSSGEFPVLGISVKGKEVGSPLPKILSFDPVKHIDADTDLLTVLIRLREEISIRDDVSPASLVSVLQLERIVKDRPVNESELISGKHGSALFLARHGSEVVQVLNRAIKRNTSQSTNVRADTNTSNIVTEINKGGTTSEVAMRLRLTPAALAQAIQRALEAGLHVERGTLVSNEIFTRVLEFMRYHRYAKLRHVREHLGSEEISLPDLRIAMAFVRREFYGEEL